MRQQLIWFFIFAMLGMPLLYGAETSPPLSGLDVMKQVQKESRKKNTRKATVNMTIYDANNKKRIRYFNYLTKHSETEDRHLITFFRPKTVKGTALLSKTDIHANTQSQWVYLPAFKSIKRLTSADKNKSFMGSDFTYSDIAGRKLDRDSYRLIKETETYYYVESTPIDKSNAAYSKIRYVISKAHQVVISARFYALDGTQLKTLNNSKVSIINDVHVVMESEMVNHQTNGKTVLIVESMDVGIPIRDDTLTIKGLTTR